MKGRLLYAMMYGITNHKDLDRIGVNTKPFDCRFYKQDKQRSTYTHGWVKLKY